ncbi:hypothetical protein GCM10009596_03590 [Arthrobacter rhombi]
MICIPQAQPYSFGLGFANAVRPFPDCPGFLDAADVCHEPGTEDLAQRTDYLRDRPRS